MFLFDLTLTESFENKKRTKNKTLEPRLSAAAGQFPNQGENNDSKSDKRMMPCFSDEIAFSFGESIEDTSKRTEMPNLSGFYTYNCLEQ